MSREKSVEHFMEMLSLRRQELMNAAQDPCDPSILADIIQQALILFDNDEQTANDIVDRYRLMNIDENAHAQQPSANHHPHPGDSTTEELSRGCGYGRGFGRRDRYGGGDRQHCRSWGFGQQLGSATGDNQSFAENCGGKRGWGHRGSMGGHRHNDSGWYGHHGRPWFQFNRQYPPQQSQADEVEPNQQQACPPRQPPCPPHHPPPHQPPPHHPPPFGPPPYPPTHGVPPFGFRHPGYGGMGFCGPWSFAGVGGSGETEATKPANSAGAGQTGNTDFSENPFDVNDFMQHSPFGQMAMGVLSSIFPQCPAPEAEPTTGKQPEEPVLDKPTTSQPTSSAAPASGATSAPAPPPYPCSSFYPGNPTALMDIVRAHLNNYASRNGVNPNVPISIANTSSVEKKPLVTAERHIELKGFAPEHIKISIDEFRRLVIEAERNLVGEDYAETRSVRHVVQLPDNQDVNGVSSSFNTAREVLTIVYANAQSQDIQINVSAGGELSAPASPEQPIAAPDRQETPAADAEMATGKEPAAENFVVLDEDFD